MLQVTCSAKNIGFIDGDLYIIVAPDTVKFSRHIGVRMPAIVIVFSHFRIPLAHGIPDTVGCITAGSPDLNRYLRFVIHIESNFRTGCDGSGEGYFENGFVHGKWLVYAIHFYGSDFLVTYGSVVQFLNPVAHPLIPILSPARADFAQFPAAHIHHTVRLKCIPVQMIKYPM